MTNLKKSKLLRGILTTLILVSLGGWLVCFALLYNQNKEQQKEIDKLKNIVAQTKLDKTYSERVRYENDWACAFTWKERTVNLEEIDDKVNKILDVMGYTYKTESNTHCYKPARLEKVGGAKSN